MDSLLERIVKGEPVSKREFAEAEPALRDALLHVQDDLAERDFPVIIVFGGPDFTGCEDMYELLHEWFDARYLRAEPFGPPDAVERQWPWLYRYWRVFPPRGSVALFLRGWTTSAVGACVRKIWDDARLDREIAHIRHLEQMLAADGALLLKFWLHVPRKLMKKRLEAARKKDAWRVADREEEVHEIYDEAKPVVERVLAGTDGPHAPWTVVDGSDRRFRDLAVTRRIAEALRERLDLPIPDAAPPEPAPADGRLDSALRQLDLSSQLDEETYDVRLSELRSRLGELHREAHARGVGAVLAFEGWDAAGKGGAIRRLTRAMDAPNYRVFSVAAPDERESARHWLWRFWHRLPRDGRVAIFDRTWYGRVLVERVEGFAHCQEWERAYADIEDFEAQLVEHGYVFAKFFLHISKEEQLRRFEARQDISFKRHKITEEDWRNRDKWGQYEAAIDDMVARTSRASKWNLVPASDKRFARVRVLEAVCAAYEERLAKKR